MRSIFLTLALLIGIAGVITGSAVNASRSVGDPAPTPPGNHSNRSNGNHSNGNQSNGNHGNGNQSNGNRSNGNHSNGNQSNHNDNTNTNGNTNVNTNSNGNDSVVPSQPPQR